MSPLPATLPDVRLPQTDASPAEAWRPGRRHTVLCVDDEASVLNSLRRFLRREPYDLVTVTEPSQALEILRRRSVSLVLSDQRMPGMTGVELLSQIRERWPQASRVMLTAYPYTVTAGDQERLALRKLLTKPWDEEQIKAFIVQVLREQESTTAEPESQPEPAPPELPEGDFRERIVVVDCRGKLTSEIAGEIVPVLGIPDSRERGVAILLRNLLSHRSGVMEVFEEIHRRVFNTGVRAGIVDASGFAASYVEAYGFPSRVFAYRHKPLSLRAKRALVVAEHGPGGTLLRSTIEAAGHACDEAGTAAEATARIDGTVYDVVFLDLDLPDRAGFRVVQHLLDLRRPIPVVALSENPETWGITTFTRKGISRNLPKPYSVREILEILHGA